MKFMLLFVTLMVLLLRINIKAQEEETCQEPQDFVKINYSEEELNNLKGKKLLGVVKSVETGDVADRTDCYVKYDTELSGEDEYHLIEGTYPVIKEQNNTVFEIGTVFLTHLGPCGTCSGLDDLYAMLTMKGIDSCEPLETLEAQIDCLVNVVGFTKPCAVDLINDSDSIGRGLGNSEQVFHYYGKRNNPLNLKCTDEGCST